MVIFLELGTVAFLCSIGTIFEVVVSNRLTCPLLSLYLHYKMPSVKSFHSQYDRTYDDIITTNWYLLPRKCQKELIILTQAAMKPHSLSIGGLFPLNIDTFVHVNNLRTSL